MRQSHQEAPARPTGTVTFLLTDIEGSTRMWEEYPQEMRKALPRHEEMVESSVADCEGNIVRSQREGDSFFIVFDHPGRAVACALQLQRTLLSERWPDGVELRVRAAIHTGEAELRRGDYFGPAVNRTARIRSVAHGGQTLVSKAAHDLLELLELRLPQEATLRLMGAHLLKDLSRPEELYELRHPDLPGDFPPIRSLEILPHNLPIQLTSFVGRENEMTEVRQILSRTRLVTLHGSGGAGKTRLAAQVAGELADEFADGVWMVELDSVTDSRSMEQQLATVMGVREDPGRPLLLTLIDHLRERRTLLVVDNCEHLINESARLVESLLKACPGLKVLATSREPLRVPGETLLRVPSLAFPDPDARVPLGALNEYDALKLFVDRALHVKPGFSFGEDDAAAVAEISRHTGGIPLAIELAAAWVNVLRPREIARRMSETGGFSMLARGSRTSRPRQQTLQAAVQWSYDLLAERERLLFNRLSVFTGSFSLDAVEGVCAGGGIEAAEILELLSSLVDKSLILVEEGPSVTRYSLLMTMRAYARERLIEAGEEDRAALEHIHWFAALAEKFDEQFDGPDREAWVELIETEHENMRQALERAMREAPDALLRLAASLRRFWHVRGHISEGRKWLEMALVETSDMPVLRAKALRGAGAFASFEGDFSAAQSFYEAGIALARDTGDEAGLAMSLNNLGIVCQDLGNYSRARDLLRESLDLERRLGSQLRIAGCLANLGSVAIYQGRYGEAQSSIEEALDISRKEKDQNLESRLLHNLAEVHFNRGNHSEARELYEQCLRIETEMGDKQVRARSLIALSALAREEGDFDRARILNQEAVSLAREVGERQACASGLLNEGNILKAEGKISAAIGVYQKALLMAREIGSRQLIADALNDLGKAAHADGDDRQALSFLKESLAMRRQMGDRAGISESLEGIAAVAKSRGDLERSARLLGAAGLIRESIGAPIAPSERAEMDALISDLRKGLGPDFERAVAEFSALPEDEAITAACLEAAADR